MAKRVQAQEGEDRIVAKSMPTMNLAFTVSTCSSTLQNPIASKSPGILKTLCRKDSLSTWKLEAKEYNPDTASSSQLWRKDALPDVGTSNLVATEEEQEHLNFHEDSISTRKLVASGNSETEGKDEIWPHNLHTSTVSVPHMEKVFSICETKIWSHSERSNEKLRCERSDMEYLSVCHSSSCSSSRYRLDGGFAICRESTREIFETVVSSDSEVDHRPNRNHWNYND